MNPDKSKEDFNRYYIQKARSSFKARFDLLLYECINHGIDSEITTEELEDFEITKHIDSLSEYIHVYWQQDDIKKYEIHGKAIERIYQEIKDWRESHKSNIDNLRKYYTEHTFPKVFPQSEFYQMVE